MQGTGEMRADGEPARGCGVYRAAPIVFTPLPPPHVAVNDFNPLRERIFRRDAHRCVYCAGVFPPEQLSLDHVQPRMRGGDNSDGNLVTACKACNTKKGSLPAWAWLADNPEERANFLKYATAVWPRHRRAVLEAARD